MSTPGPSEGETGETDLKGSDRSRKPPRLGLLIALSIASLTVSLAAMELGIRMWKENLSGVPNPSQNVSMIGDLYSHIYPGSYDPDLGYIPTPGAIARDSGLRTTAHILASGVRSNGKSRTELSGRPIIRFTGGA